MDEEYYMNFQQITMFRQTNFMGKQILSQNLF
jgi:hypothetical protein